MKIARRSLLKAGSGLVAFAALGRTATAEPASDDGAARLVALLGNRHAAIRLGRRHLSRHPEERDAAQLAARLTTRLAPAGGPIRRAALRRSLAADFAAGRVTALDGWILANTEVDLCALAALKAPGTGATLSPPPRHDG